MATETKAVHTPGPWTLKPHGAIVGGDFRELTNGSAQPQIAMACAVESGPEQQEANARLIAAAPEMLRALECLMVAVNCHDSQGGTLRKTINRANPLTIEMIEMVIAKAKGEL